MSKLGLHIISWNQSQAILDFIARAKPRVVKMLEFNDMNTDVARASSPGTLFIGRQYVDQQPLDNPAANARDFFNALLPAIYKMGHRIDVWEGYNEIAITSVDMAKRYSDFTVAWAALMHAQGLKCAAYSFSVGNPDFSYWPYLLGGLRACDYLALHEYDSPRMDANPGYMCLRYRKVRALLPADAQKPILITECGIDDGHNRGWKTYASGSNYISQLGWYDSQMMQDQYVVGSTIFTVDGADWGDFDLVPILNPLADYIISHPTPLPPPPPQPPPPAGTITAVTFSPAVLTSGQLLNVSITVKNTSAATLQTMGPDPGFVYNEGETFYTRGFPEMPSVFRVGVDFDGRSGIDHPFRWGLGGPVAPGQSVTVAGAIRLNTVRSINYWAGLVRERVAWLQDSQGKKVINVNAPPPPSTTPEITAVTLSPTSLKSGDALNVSITVQNNSAVTLNTMAPDPGYVYTEGNTFLTDGFAEVYDTYRVGVDFFGRIGIDHPYRWGFGAPLPPGQSATVTGMIKLLSAQSKSYWAGLVRERIVWLEDRDGPTTITVTTPTPPPPIVQITSVTFEPTTLSQGQLLKIAVTVLNNTSVLIKTQGPDPGFIYNEGDNFYTKNAPPVQGVFRIGVDYDGRTGIDHPYRWGFGGSVPPGEQVVVTGYIQLNRKQATRYWVGLVEELIAWRQDVLGQQMITVVAP